MTQYCPLKDSSACQHPERKGVCKACHFDFETLDPDEGMFRLRRVNAEAVFAEHEKAEAEKQKASADAALIAELQAKLAQAKNEAALAKAQTEGHALQDKPPPPPTKPKAASPTHYTLIRADGSLMDCSAEPVMIPLPAGRYLRGSPATEFGRCVNEGPQMEVDIQAFEMGITPITEGQWKHFVEENKVEKYFWRPLFVGAELLDSPLLLIKQTVDCPAVSVSFNDAQAYIAWLNDRVGTQKGYFRLPSEAEWEYAARATTTTPFHFGETINSEHANFDGRNGHYPGTTNGRCRNRITPVKTFNSNGFGLYDVHGNVWEMCEDSHHDSYAGSPIDGSAWKKNNSIFFSDERIIRGGSWASTAETVRAAFRSYRRRGERSSYVGFRLARTVF